MAKKIKKMSKNPPISHKKNLDNIKLLVSCEEFQKIVNGARGYLEISESGLLNDKVSEKWHEEKLYKKSDIILSSKSIIEQEKMVRKKLQSGEISRNMANKQMNLILQKVPVNYLTNTARFIVDKFRLPLNYECYIRQYILFNTINAPYNNFVVGPYHDVKKISGVRFVPITIYAKLTKEEIKYLKREIELIGKNLPKINPLKDIDKKLEIEEWLKKENRFRKTFDEEYYLTAEEIAEKVFNNCKKPKSIYEARRELNELRKKRFKQSGKTGP